MTYDIARDRDLERAEAFRERALEWADEEEIGDDISDEAVIAMYADYCDYCYEQMIDRKIDEAYDREVAA